jgi:hypothetical protein
VADIDVLKYKMFYNMISTAKGFTICLLLFSCLSVSHKLMAQCSPAPRVTGTTFAFGVTDSVTPSQTAPQPYLVCDNASLFYFGNDPDTVYLEGSARLWVKSCFNLVVYMRNNSQLRCDTVTLTRVFSDVIYDPTFTTFVDTAGSVFQHFTSCLSMAYNYAAFPNGNAPCASPTGWEEKADALSWEAYPNPVTTTLHLSLPVAWRGIVHCELYRLDGGLVAQQTVSHANADIDLARYPAGNYLLRLAHEGKAMTRIVAHH